MLAIGAGLAFGLKRFYAEADADALGFVLAPTAALAGLISGVPFEPESGVGYVSREAAYLIVPGCAGLNFTIAAFGSLLIAFLPCTRSGLGRALWLCVAGLVAAAATPVANGIRIALDLALRHHALPDWLSRADAHRIEGVVVYLGMLGLLHHCAAAWMRTARPASRRTLAIPLAAYLLVSLGLPWLHGAGARPDFDHHAGVVLAASLALAILVAGLLPRRRSGIMSQAQAQAQARLRSDGQSEVGFRTAVE